MHCFERTRFNLPYHSQTLIFKLLSTIHSYQTIRSSLYSISANNHQRVENSHFAFNDWIEVLSSTCDKLEEYENAVSKAQQQRVIQKMIERLKQIDSNKKHQFYQIRKEQVRLISDVIEVLRIIKDRIMRATRKLSLNADLNILEDIEGCVAMVQKFKFREKVAEKRNYHIKYNFSKLQFSENQKSHAQIISKQLSKKQSTSNGILTTTRPSSTNKSLEYSRTKRVNLHSDLNICMKINEIIEAQHLEVERTKTSRETVQKKISRCQTANVNNFMKPIKSNAFRKSDKVQTSSNIQRSNFQIKNQQMRIKMKSEKSIEYKFTPAYSNGELTQRKSRDDSFKEDFCQFSQKSRSKDLSSSRKNNGVKKHKTITIAEILKREEKEKEKEKEKKHSMNITFNTNLEILDRKYKSQENMSDFASQDHLKQEMKKVKRRLLESSDKKLTSKDISRIEEDYANETEVEIVKKKNEEKSLATSRRKINPLTESLNVKEESKRKCGEIGSNRIKSRFEFEDENNSEQQKSNIGINANENFKINIDDINSIRKEFVRAGWQNKIIGSENEENSVFFIEQGFLGCRENLKFQQYLKNMKQSLGTNEATRPFSIENECTEDIDGKIIEMERLLAFKKENDWIQNHYKTGRLGQGAQGLKLIQASF